MAVATDLVVEMRPRQRRRLARATIAAGVLGALLAAGLLTRTPSHPGGGSSHAAPRVGTGHLVFGMTPQAVERITGRPAATQGSCLFFHPTKDGMVGSVSVQPSFARRPFDPSTTRDLKLCFLGGAYSEGFLREYDATHHKWVWAPWPVSLSPGSPPS